MLAAAATSAATAVLMIQGAHGRHTGTASTDDTSEMALFANAWRWATRMTTIAGRLLLEHLLPTPWAASFDSAAAGAAADGRYRLRQLHLDGPDRLPDMAPGVPCGRGAERRPRRAGARGIRGGAAETACSKHGQQRKTRTRRRSARHPHPADGNPARRDHRHSYNAGRQHQRDPDPADAGRAGAARRGHQRDTLRRPLAAPGNAVETHNGNDGARPDGTPEGPAPTAQ